MCLLCCGSWPFEPQFSDFNPGRISNTYFKELHSNTLGTNFVLLHTSWFILNVSQTNYSHFSTVLKSVNTFSIGIRLKHVLINVYHYSLLATTGSWPAGWGELQHGVTPSPPTNNFKNNLPAFSEDNQDTYCRASTYPLSKTRLKLPTKLPTRHLYILF